MRILLCHNYYQQRGGEDESFEAERELLVARGHDVVSHTVHNDDIDRMSRLEAAARAIWNPAAKRAVVRVIREHRPDVMHCTNTFPLLSPAVYYAARRNQVAVVQSLRNYRLLCPNALFHRQGNVCEDCLGKRFAWSGVRHGCYRGSRMATAAVAAMTSFHRLIGTWQRTVDLYFAPTEFARGKYVAAGFAAERITVKPNFIYPRPDIGDGAGGFAVYVGRLSAEKGVETLLSAWEQMPNTIPLKIIGTGPLDDVVERAADRDPQIEWLKRRPSDEVLEILGKARVLIMPSTWYETFGRTMMEAYARGTPVIASRLGAMAEVVDDGRTGYLFETRNAASLADAVVRLSSDSPRTAEFRANARQAYETRYSAERNYEILLDTYRRAIQSRRGGAAAATETPVDEPSKSTDFPSATVGEFAVEPYASVAEPEPNRER